MEKVEAVLADAWARGTLAAVVLSDAARRDPEGCRKVVVKPILLRGRPLCQFAYHYERKVTHRNLPPDEARAEIAALLAGTFRQALIQTTESDHAVTVGRSGRASVRTRPAPRAAPDPAHDRRKNYLLPEGEPCDFLIRLGVMNRDGGVVAARRDKFKQINRFLEMVADVADELTADGPLRVVDFGCGKAYLTFALYHYLHVQKGRDVRIVGRDVKRDVVEHCAGIARDLGYEDLTFQVGDIRGYAADESVDMVVTLHACDTATDDALAKAVGWGAKVILSVPCCQHELFKQIENPVMTPLLKHGILRERLSALVTDALRASLLEQRGYAVQALEFIDWEHTAKNLLIRAVRRERQGDAERLRAEYEAFRDFWHVQPYMEAALKNA